MQAALATLAKVAPSSATLLIYGESGTGKEIAAKAVHFNSPRAAGPFLAINCAAIPEGLIESELFGHEKGAFTGASEKRRGLFEQAAGGTLFLDEIGEMPIALQPKLLRVLQERELRRVGGGEAIKVDVRIIAATHQPLDRLAATGKFRQDLYYRLNVVSVELPPLRLRQGDIPRLALHFLKKYGGKRNFAFAPEAMKKLLGYSWPGNVRQLEAAIERATLLSDGDVLRPEDLPPEIIRPVSANLDFGIAIPAEGLDLEALEKSLLLQAYERAGRNVTRAATLLGLTRRTMQYRLKKTLGVEAGTDEEGE